ATSISVGQRPTYGFPLENKALKGRKPNDDNHFQNQNNTIAAALTGLWCVNIFSVGRCPTLMLITLSGRV
ncbi:MAG: hypothetical protein LBE12_00790, partial [Planctomycetaceae bacterium]|nr:hypothetical protein [Planctomycetaceae bacterium]